MRLVVQRVSRAQVSVAGEVIGRVDGPGLVILVGVTHDDTPDLATSLARKVATLRIMRDERSLVESGGGALVISQFTLYADTRKGRRPSWSGAAPGPIAEPLVDSFAKALAAEGVTVETGRFGADMAVDLVNDGPVTLVLQG